MYPLTDTEPAESPYLNPEAAPQARRLSPATLDGVLRAVASGVPQYIVASTYGVSRTTVARVIERCADDPRLAVDVSTLSELAHAEQQLVEALGDTPRCRLLIDMVRAGHLIRRARQNGVQQR